MSAEETAKYYPLALAAVGIIVIVIFALVERHRSRGLKPWVDSDREKF